MEDSFLQIIYIYIYIIGVWGVSPTGKSFRFVRACERARRGEAAWASERHFDSGARAAVYDFSSSPAAAPPKPCRCPVVRLSGGFRLKTHGFTTFVADNLAKPM